MIQVLVSIVTLPWLSVVITLRADFHARCVEIPALAELLRSGSYPLAAAGFDALFEMITRPAHRAGLVFDEGLPGLILAETGSDAGALPLMAFALQQLYEGRELSGRLTHEAYAGFGGVQGAIVARAESVFHSIAEPLSPASLDRAIATPRRDLLGPETLSDVFRELVQVEEGRTPTRKRAPFSRIARTPAAAKLVELFVAARLLVADGGDDPLIEVAHEALLTRWPRLSNWIETVFDDLRLRSQLQRAAREWEERDGDPAYMWSDERSVDAHTRLRRLMYTLSPVGHRKQGHGCR